MKFSTGVRHQEIKGLVVCHVTFYKKYLQNLRYNIKQSCIFHLILLGNSSNLILSFKNRGNVFFFFKPQKIAFSLRPYWTILGPQLPFFIHFQLFFCDKYSILTCFATFYCFFLYYCKKKKKKNNWKEMEKRHTYEQLRPFCLIMILLE